MRGPAENLVVKKFCFAIIKFGHAAMRHGQYSLCPLSYPGRRRTNFRQCATSDACGTAAPGSREPSRLGSCRSKEFAVRCPAGAGCGVSAIRLRSLAQESLNPSPGAVGPASRRRHRRRRRYADAPAATLLTGLRGWRTVVAFARARMPFFISAFTAMPSAPRVLRLRPPVCACGGFLNS